MIYKVQKLYQGFVSVRDYAIQKCLSSGEDLILSYDGKIMTVKRTDLSKFWQIHSKRFFKKFGDGTYSLVDFKFISDDEKKEMKKESIDQLMLWGE